MKVLVCRIIADRKEDDLEAMMSSKCNWGKTHVMKIPKVRNGQAATTDLRQSCKNDVTTRLHLLGICAHTMRMIHHPNCRGTLTVKALAFLLDVLTHSI